MGKRVSIVSVLALAIVLAVTGMIIRRRKPQVQARSETNIHLWVQEGNRLVEAPFEDLELAHKYSDFKEKGPIKGGSRATIMTRKRSYRVGEPVRVIHVFEVVAPGRTVYIMGPKKICDEYVDGKAAKRCGGPWSYAGLVGRSPMADFNYEITSHTFETRGQHTIQWMGETPSNKVMINVY